MRAVLPLVLVLGGALALDAGHEVPSLRRPIALALSLDGHWLYAANQRSGSVSVIDIDGSRLAAEIPIGRRLSDLVASPDGRQLLATDEVADELITLSCQGQTVSGVRRTSVALYPVSVRVSGDGRSAFVASLWSRQISILDLSPQAQPAKVVSLPFAPRLLLPLQEDRKLLIADAFGGQLAVLDVNRGELDAVHSLPAQNIRGLALSRDDERLMIAHQNLNPRTPTTRDAIHWGNLLTNNVRVLPLADVLTPNADLLRGDHLLQLGIATAGAGDPAGLAITKDGQILTSLSGVGQLAIGPELIPDEQRLAIGQRPTAIIASSDGRRAFVADTFGDSVVVVDVSEKRVVKRIALGMSPELRPEDRGELAFYDARLSHDGWFSCHSCHTDGHTTGQRNDNLGDGSFGAPKRILSLRGVNDTAPWAWNGSITGLDEQVRKSIATTMHGKAVSRELVEDLTAYLRTLPPLPALAKLRGGNHEESARQGQEVFRELGCATCHVPPTYTSPKTYDVGLHDEVGNRVFNPPSLRGVSQGGPYFHDGRAATLDDVFVKHRHQLKAELPKEQLGDLLTFLRSI